MSVQRSRSCNPFSESRCPSRPLGITFFEAITGTLLINSYRFSGSPSVVVDVGASIGDFALLASRENETRVYAFEKDSGYLRYLRDKMKLNGRKSVQIFEESANRHTLKRIIESQEDKIDFLKVDCEGCEDDLLLHCPRRGTRQGEIYRSRNP